MQQDSLSFSLTTMPRCSPAKFDSRRESVVTAFEIIIRRRRGTEGEGIDHRPGRERKRDLHSPPFVGKTNKRVRNVTYGRRERALCQRKEGTDGRGNEASCVVRAGGTWKNASRHVPPVDGVA